jgi:DNA-binding transcriptional regulator YiaG
MCYRLLCHLNGSCVVGTSELRRLKLISEGRLPNPWKHSRSRLPINATCRRLLGQRMNSDPKQKRERFQQLTQNPKVKTGKAFAADLRKSKIHPTVKKLTAWRKLNRLSQRKAVAVLAQYYFHATFPSIRSWEEGRRSPNSHTAAILEKFLLDHPTVESPKKLKPR